ncbi:ANTAR domain-containing protein [Streptomyces sp. NPDC001595]|uniref:ANTAR domain-containing protein n=1 Tax=Streptomyces sp. NPDC001532 TaxID=3154520 RepID=UPI003332187B
MDQPPRHTAAAGDPDTPPALDAGPVREAPHRSSEELDRRNRLLARERVSRAQEVLRGRYRIASHEEAFALLKGASQQFNIKLHTLADAVVRTPAPDAGADTWFPGRPRHRAPMVPGLAVNTGEPGSQGAVLKAALQRVLAITQTSMGNVQLMEGGRLHMTRHTGLNKYFTDFFTFVDAPTTACSQAAEERRQVTVRDVATADVFDEPSRHAILQAGSRAAHSLPLGSPAGAVLGMISSHHDRPLPGFTRAQLAALERTGADVGRWLSWHRHTVVRDALEHLHRSAGARPAAR